MRLAPERSGAIESRIHLFGHIEAIIRALFGILDPRGNPVP
jgi:hypothetical protein